MTLVQLNPKHVPADLKIGDLAKLSGKTQRALRLYEEMGLLTPGTRTIGGFRVYGPDAIERVQWIGKLQELGFTLHQIQELVPSEGGSPKEAMARVRKAFADKHAEVELQIARLQQLQREMDASLEYLETCVDACTSSHSQGTSCCGTCQTHGDSPAPSLVEGMRS
jgi:MerR family transcriptional regulator, copper efflux regulator